MSNYKIYNQELTDWAKTYNGPKFMSILCDPPYSISFMNKEFDKFKSPKHFQDTAKQWGESLLPHLYPGAIVMMFSSPRTWHRLACGMEDAGFELWDTCMYLHLQGFPKTFDISKRIDSNNGDKREVVGRKTGRQAYPVADIRGMNFAGGGAINGGIDTGDITAPGSEQSEVWFDYKNCALKPAWEPLLCFRVPSKNTYTDNALMYGSGTLNINGGRVENDASKKKEKLELDIVNVIDKIKTWNYKDYVKNVTLQLLRNDTGVGIHTTCCDIALDHVLLLPESQKLILSAIFAELLLAEVLVKTKENTPFVQENVNADISALNSTVDIAEREVLEVERKQLYLKPYIVIKDVLMRVLEQTQNRIKVEDILLILSGSEKFWTETEENALNVYLQNALKHTILNQSKTFQNLDGNSRMEFVCAMNVIITEFIMERLITSMVNILEKRKKNLKYQIDSGYPSNVILDEEAGKELNIVAGSEVNRYFYCPKPSTAEKEAGLEDREAETVSDGREKAADNPYQHGKTLRRNTHPTVKPIKLIEYFAKLLLPPDSVKPRRILIPFAGVASEMIGCLQAGWDEVVGVEQEEEYCQIAEKRLKHWTKPDPIMELLGE